MRGGQDVYKNYLDLIKAHVQPLDSHFESVLTDKFITPKFVICDGIEPGSSTDQSLGAHLRGVNTVATEKTV